MSGNFTKEQWQQVCTAWSHRCAYCRCDGELTIDHVIPVSKGGPHHISNIVPACKACNDRKSHSDLPVALQRLGVSVLRFNARRRLAQEIVREAA